ncbi:hypothetical protein NIES2130_10595 [Scytonema sp. HK-05]|nr:hypothetical protein NIES2130_10595 [Scytonema sp. HK-05]
MLGQEADTRSSDILPKSKACVLTPQDVEGPYYFDPKLLRTDITEGKEGVPLKLKNKVKIRLLLNYMCQSPPTVAKCFLHRLYFCTYRGNAFKGRYLGFREIIENQLSNVF